jgi:hypothetical protein
MTETQQGDSDDQDTNKIEQSSHRTVEGENVGVIPFTTDQQVDLSEQEWAEYTDSGVYHYDYQSDPTFGSPSNYSGYISQTGCVLIVETHVGKARPVARKLIDDPQRLTLSPQEQHTILNSNDGVTIIEAHHPKYRDQLVEDMTIDSDMNVDEMRAVISEEKYPVEKAHLRYNSSLYEDKRVKIFFPELNARIPSTLAAFVWFENLLTSIDRLETGNTQSTHKHNTTGGDGDGN